MNKKYGYIPAVEKIIKESEYEGFEIVRVIAEHKERYIVASDSGEFEAEVIGNLRFSAVSREDFPAVGDWVALRKYDDNFALIHKIVPRQSLLTRKAVGVGSSEQIIAANVDYAFIVQAIDRDYSVNRLERYLTICRSGKVNPIILLTKIDLILPEEVNTILQSIKKRIDNIPVIAISNKTQSGYREVEKIIEPAKTYCMLGSSGAGKSTLINNLSGKELMKTGKIGKTTGRGRHVTCHLELIILASGGILIDNPGMREIGIADHSQGISETFDDIFKYAEKCKFNDCTHSREKGCTVIEAVENGEIDMHSYKNYLKMQKEHTHYESTRTEKKKKDKSLGKIVRNYKKVMGGRK